MAILVLLNNFMHDFSAAGWLFGSVVIWRLFREGLLDGESLETAIRVLDEVSFLMRLSLTGIVVFGIGRALAYGEYEWNVAAGDSQITLLIVKHVLFGGIFLWGLVYYVRARRILRRVASCV